MGSLKYVITAVGEMYKSQNGKLGSKIKVLNVELVTNSKRIHLMCCFRCKLKPVHGHFRLS